LERQESQSVPTETIKLSRHPRGASGSAKPATPRRDSSRRGIQSIEVGFRIVAALTAGGVPQSLKELSAVANLAPSNCHRYLASFVRTGLLVQEPDTSRYDFGPVAVRIGLAALARLDPVAIGLSALSRLVAETGHTGLLAVLGDRGAVIVRWLNGRRPIQTTLSVGSVLPITGSATGRVFLAFRPEAETAALVRAERRNEKDFDVVEIREQVRGAGTAQVAGDLIPGLSAAAAPILDDGGNAAAVLTLIGLREGFGPQVLAQLSSIAADASRELGWSAP
jgi:DNA-binding IclR family transcriptional regulator